jgi:hypothetical protein
LNLEERTTANLIELYHVVLVPANESQSNMSQHLDSITNELNNRKNGLSFGPLKSKEEKQMYSQFVDDCQGIPDYRLANKAYKLIKEIDSILNTEDDRLLALHKVRPEILLELYAIRQKLGEDSMKSNSIHLSGLPKDIPEDELTRRLIDLFKQTVGQIKVNDYPHNKTFTFYLSTQIDPMTKHPAVYLFLDKGQFNGEAQITFDNVEGAVLKATNKYNSTFEQKLIVKMTSFLVWLFRCQGTTIK